VNILFTVCGRAGSKGIRNKNLRDFCGYPLLYYTLSEIDLVRGGKSEWNTDVVINSDSPDLLKLAEANPFFDVDLIRRSDELGGDAVPKIAVIHDCLTQMEQRKKKTYDVVVDLDITSPLRKVQDLYHLVDTHVRTGADVTTSVTDSRRNPYFNMVRKTEHGYKKVLDADFTARQQAPQTFDMNASLYAYRPDFLDKNLGVLDGYCECIHMEDTGILDLDHENDLTLMEVIARYLYGSDPQFSEVRGNIVRKSEKSSGRF
jgi:CMP-N,N'-diacetyllegionaminic acid synthase